MPLFCVRDDELELAERVLEEFKSSCISHEKKSELYDRISSIESAQNDYKLVRGFCALLERRCVFSANSYVRDDSNNSKTIYDAAAHPENGIVTTAITTTAANTTISSLTVDPIEVRRMLFEESSRRGFALTEFERDSIVNSISEKLRVPTSSSDDIKRAMWSDLDDNLIFEHFDAIDAKTLVGWYNLSLMQTLLFNATKMEFRISGGTNWKRILRNVKRLGLMYYMENRAVERQEGQEKKYDRADRHDDNNYDDESNNISSTSSLVCSLEGPLSLFKLTDRYGTSLAKLLPSIVLPTKVGSVDWQIDAWILRKTMMQGKKLYQFKISNEQAPLYLADPFYRGTATTATATATGGGTRNTGPAAPSSASFSSSPLSSFDSLVEEKFARRFNEVAGDSSGWTLVREPDPLVLADGRAFIPDFMFEKYGRRVYLEIVGFWTPEYLQRKLQKIEQVMSRASITNNNDNTTAGTTAEGKEVDLFIAINEELAGAKLSTPTSAASSSTTMSFASSSYIPVDRLIFYKNDSVPIRHILDYLKALDKEMIDRKTSDPNLRIEIDCSKDIISLRDLAEKYQQHVPIEVISKIVLRDYSDRYIPLSSSGGGGRQQHYSYLVSKSKAKKLEPLLTGVKSFAKVCAILSENDIPEACHAELVEKLGYDVIWRSMDISTATIERKKKHSG
ncbi:MAG TPA: DUF790 family protein [Nitrososphaera sp.]|nr:DUF790 family protein [Nitrososphaera sp.]